MRTASWRSFTTARLLLLGLLLLPGPVSAAPCSEAPVAGDTRAEVEAKCGQATVKEQHDVEVQEVDGRGKRTVSTTFEQWIYDRGPEEVMQAYSFEDGSLVQIVADGYGRPYLDRGDSCRNGELLAVGDSTADAYLKCGLPVAREQKGEKVAQTEENGTKRRTTIRLVEWTYRYGPTLPGYTVTFERGTAVSIRPREFGK